MAELEASWVEYHGMGDSDSEVLSYRVVSLRVAVKMTNFDIVKKE